MIPVEGHSNLFRDENSGAIVNCDNIAYEQYLLAKSKREFDKLQLNELKREIDDIKITLKQLLESHGPIKN